MNGAPAVQEPGPVAGASPVPDPVPSPVVEVVAAAEPVAAPVVERVAMVPVVVHSKRARSFLTVGLFLAGIAAALLVMSLREERGER